VAWLAYIDDLGVEAACLSGVDWLTLRDRYAMMRTTEYKERFAAHAGIGEREAASEFLSQLLFVALSYDDAQSGTWDRCGATGLDESLLSGTRYAEIDAALRATVGDRLVYRDLDEGDDLYGYTQAFGISAIGAVGNIPAKIESELRRKVNLHSAYDMYVRQMREREVM
jgi:hypothetical protein